MGTALFYNIIEISIFYNSVLSVLPQWHKADQCHVSAFLALFLILMGNLSTRVQECTSILLLPEPLIMLIIALLFVKINYFGYRSTLSPMLTLTFDPLIQPTPPQYWHHTQVLL